MKGVLEHTGTINMMLNCSIMLFQILPFMYCVIQLYVKSTKFLRSNCTANRVVYAEEELIENCLKRIASNCQSSNLHWLV